MFVDQVKIYARAGKGGDGSVHFHRGKHKPKGGPDGGDGGRGGDVVLRVDNSTDSLRNYFFNSKLLAPDGKAGSAGNCSGKSGKDGIFRVPPGLVVTRLTPAGEDENGQTLYDREPVADLTQAGTDYVLCKGGKGGRGNSHFKSPTNQAPREFTAGQDGGEGMFHFELRSIADAGLVGFPNAGKSTLLTKISSAHPKIANYPFTTLQPHVGVVVFSDTRRTTVADIPGLIEGAHANVGLGHDFLRHIMRCSVLLFVVDTAGSEARDPVEDIATLRQEIKLYSAELAKRPWCIIANKMDLPEAEENLPRLKERFKRVKVFPISANENMGVDKLLAFLSTKVGHDHFSDPGR
jgi:GTP-binding protein